MAEDWDAIAAEVKAALGGVGFDVTLETPGEAGGTAWAPVRGAPVQRVVRVIDERVRLRDADGSLTGTVERILTMPADGGPAPTKACRVLVRGVWLEVVEVRPEAPGGVDLLYEVSLGD